MSHRPIPSQLHLRKGETGEIRIGGQGVGGYLWNAEVTAGSGVVEPGPASPPAPGAIGAGSEATFRVRWSVEHDGTVRLTYKRPWDDTAEDTVDVPVVLVSD